MKKQTKQLSKLLRKALLNILIVGLIFPVYTFAQPKKVTAPLKTIWYVDLTVTIKGNGETINDDETTITNWSVDRTYSSAFKLNSMGKSGRFTVYEYRQAKPKNEIPMHVKIKDQHMVVIKDPGEGGSYENTTTKTIWEIDETVSIPNAMKLATDERLRSYNIFFPIQFFDMKLKSKSQTEIYRSDFGYGDAPTHEIDSMKVRSTGAIWSLPDVKYLINNQAIQQHDFLFPANFTTAWGYDSAEDFPELLPDKDLPGIPDSKKKVNIRVIYRFSKKPFY